MSRWAQESRYPNGTRFVFMSCCDAFLYQQSVNGMIERDGHTLSHECLFCRARRGGTVDGDRRLFAGSVNLQGYVIVANQCTQHDSSSPSPANQPHRRRRRLSGKKAASPISPHANNTTTITTNFAPPLSSSSNSTSPHPHLHHHHPSNLIRRAVFILPLRVVGHCLGEQQLQQNFPGNYLPSPLSRDAVLRSAIPQ